METTTDYTRQKLTQLLTDAGIRPSMQRLAIMEYVVSARTHPSADDIYAALAKEYPTLSRTTVFNTMRLMVEHGLVNDIDISADATRYDATLFTPHAHFLCRKCGRIFDVEMDPSQIALPDDFDCDNINVFFKGICPECKKNPDATD